MAPALAVVDSPPAAHLTQYVLSTADAVDAWMARLRATTRAGYTQDLGDLGKWLGTPDIVATAEVIISQVDNGSLNRLVLSYMQHLSERGLSASSKNRRLACVRSLLKIARLMDLTALVLDVPAFRAQPVRDNRGPTQSNLERLTAFLENLPSRTKVWRDRCIIHLMLILGLRRSEVHRLDVADLDLESDPPAVRVWGKGQDAQTSVSLPPGLAALLAKWLERHPTRQGALFVSLARSADGTDRLSSEGIWWLTRSYGHRAGIGVLRPHGLRHASCTAALDAGSQVRDVQKHMRHKSVSVTLNVYDDANRGKLALGVAKRLDAIYS